MSVAVGIGIGPTFPLPGGGSALLPPLWNPSNDPVLLAKIQQWIDPSDITTVQTVVNNLIQIDDKTANAWDLAQGDAGLQPLWGVDKINGLDCISAPLGDNVRRDVRYNHPDYNMTDQRLYMGVYGHGERNTDKNIILITNESAAVPFTGDMSLGHMGNAELMNGRPEWTHYTGDGALPGGQLFDVDGPSNFGTNKGLLISSEVPAGAIDLGECILRYNGITQSNSAIAYDWSAFKIIQSRLAVQNNLSSSVFSNRMGEYFNFHTIPTLAERQKVEGYLAWKWGFQADLDVAHPWRNQPPRQDP